MSTPQTTPPFLSDKQLRELIDAAQFAATVLGKIPAFGDTIGTKVNKAQLGIAQNRLMLALTSISRVEAWQNSGGSTPY